MDLNAHANHEASYINDIRDVSDFKGISFSNYRKSEVKRAFADNIHRVKLEAACYWCAELVCAGHFMDVWEIFLYFLGKYVHLGNPRLVIYLESRFRIFRNIMEKEILATELHLRNVQNIRKLFAEVVCILSLSPRKHCVEPIRINRVEEFDMTHMPERLKAPCVKYAEPVYQEEDPKELYIAINEFSYSVSKEGKSLVTACYWIEWVIEFDVICKRNRQVCKCQRRNYVHVDPKYQKDIIWLIWDALLHYATADGHGEFIQRIMQSLRELFSIKYTTGCCKRRRYLLYFAVGLLTDPVPTSVEIVSLDHKRILASVVEQIHMVYRQIKHNEVSPNTDYLFSSVGGRNTMEQSIRKLEIMDSVGGISRSGDDDDIFG